MSSINPIEKPPRRNPRASLNIKIQQLQMSTMSSFSASESFLPRYVTKSGSWLFQAQDALLWSRLSPCQQLSPSVLAFYGSFDASRKLRQYFSSEKRPEHKFLRPTALTKVPWEEWERYMSTAQKTSSACHELETSTLTHL